jgi:hypothetical protein
MSARNIFSFVLKAPALLALAAFILDRDRPTVWGAESLRLGFSGASATQLAVTSPSIKSFSIFTA